MKNIPNITQRIIITNSLYLIIALITIGLFYFQTIKQQKIVVSFNKHPYTVGNTIRSIQVNIYAIQTAIYKIDKNNLDETESTVNAIHEIVLTQIELIRQRYLGNPQKVETFYIKYNKWLQTNILAFNFFRNNEQLKWQQTKNNANSDFKELMEISNDLLAFTEKKAAYFNEKSISKMKSSYNLWISASVILILSYMVLGWWVYSSLKKPLNYLINKLNSIPFSNEKIPKIKTKKNQLLMLDSALSVLDFQAKILNKQVKDKERILKELGEYQNHLEKIVVERTIKLKAELDNKIAVEKELTEHKKNLENEVKKRTADLEIKNKEFEEKNKELIYYNDLFVDREYRINELKERIKQLEKNLTESYNKNETL